MYDEMYEKDGKYARQVIRHPDNKFVVTVQIARMYHGDNWDLLVSTTNNGEDDGMYAISLHNPDVDALTGEMITLFECEEKGYLVERETLMSLREFGATLAEIADLPDKFWDDVEDVYE